MEGWSWSFTGQVAQEYESRRLDARGADFLTSGGEGNEKIADNNNNTLFDSAIVEPDEKGKKRA
jgi:hypothetical protein